MNPLFAVWEQHASTFRSVCEVLSNVTDLEWDVQHTGGGCFALQADDNANGIYSLTGGESQLPQDTQGPWTLCHYSEFSDETEVFSGVFLSALAGTVAHAHQSRVPCTELVSKLVDRTSNPQMLPCGQPSLPHSERCPICEYTRATTCDECARSFGPHYTGPCEH